MPVIQLPRDTRGSELGSAIAGATKSVSDALVNQQISTGVAEIMQDPTIPEAQKGVRALKDFGDKGYETYKKFVQTNALEAQMQHLLANTGLAKMRQDLVAEQTRQTQAQANLLTQTTPATVRSGEAAATTAEASVPFASQIAAAKAGQETGAATMATATADRAPEIVDIGIEQKRAAAGKDAGEALKSRPEKELLDLKVQQAKQFIDQNNQLFAGGLNTAGKQYDQLLIGMGIDPASPGGMHAKNSALLEPDPLKRGDVFSKAAGEVVKRNFEASKFDPLTPKQDERVVGAEKQAASAEAFLSAFNRGGSQQTGWPALAPVKQWLEQKGVAQGDPNFVQMFNATLQQVGDAARSGSQFYSSGVLKLAQQTTPNIAGSALHAIMATNEIAARNIATLEAQRRDMGPGQPKAGTDAAIKRWEAIKQKTDVDSYTIRPWTVQVQRPDGTIVQERVPVVDNINPPPTGHQVFDKDGRLIGPVVGLVGSAGDPSTVVLYGGNQVDPKTMKNVFDAKSSFKVGDDTFTGAEIISIARKFGVTPEEELRKLQAVVGSKPAARAPIR